MQVHHITAGRSDKNIGKAINDIVQHLPLTDWVCLRDIDTMPMDHVNFFRQCEEIATNSGFDLVGCMTNRSGMRAQLHKGEISNDWNLLNHLQEGKRLFAEHGSKVYPLDNTIAGFFMLFSVQIWIKAGGFREGKIRMDLDKTDLTKHKEKDKFFDWHFCNDVIKAGGKIGLAKGIYVFHLYRPWSNNPKRATEHLK